MTLEANDPNLFAAPAVVDPAREQIDVLLERAGAVRIERIVSQGHATAEGAWYDQDADEWVALLQGEATIAYPDGKSVKLAPGDWVAIPARCRHRVASTSSDPPAIWLAVHVSRTPDITTT